MRGTERQRRATSTCPLPSFLPYHRSTSLTCTTPPLSPITLIPLSHQRGALGHVFGYIALATASLTKAGFSALPY